MKPARTHIDNEAIERESPLSDHVIGGVGESAHATIVPQIATMPRVMAALRMAGRRRISPE
jgi:hypothetical protein